MDGSTVKNSKLGAQSGTRLFASALCERGPHSFTREYETSRQFHRIFSIKAGERIVVAGSRRNADAIFWAESQPEISSLCEQPLRINGSLNKRPYFTFDLSVVHRLQGEILYEVVAESQCERGIDDRLCPPYWNAVEDWCNCNGRTCAVLTDVELSKHAMSIRNWRSLLGFVRIALRSGDTSLETEVLQVIRDTGGLSVHQIRGYIAPRDEQNIISASARLLHKGSLVAQLDSMEFSRHTTMRCAE